MYVLFYVKKAALNMDMCHHISNSSLFSWMFNDLHIEQYHKEVKSYIQNNRSGSGGFCVLFPKLFE